MGNVSQDMKYAFRSMRQSPLFTGIVIGTLALAIGANVAIFTVTDAAMLRPFSYPHIDRIVALAEKTRAGQIMSVAWPTSRTGSTQNQAFEHLGLYRGAAVNLTTGGQPERLNGADGVVRRVRGGRHSADARAQRCSLEDDRPGAGRVAVISERLWRTRFNADPGILGRSIVLNGDSHTVVGIMPPGMRFPSRLTDVWLPLGPAIPAFLRAALIPGCS